MSRRTTGSVYVAGGAFYLSITLDRRRHFPLTTCPSIEEAEVRRSVVADIAQKLKRAGKVGLAEPICRQAAAADATTLAGILRLVDGVVKGTERALPPQTTSNPVPSSKMTVREFGEIWTANELAQRHPGRVLEIDQTENTRRMKKHVYPVVFDGTTIGDVPLEQFTLDMADHVLAQPTLPRGSVRHVAQCMLRLMNLAVYPARVLKVSPLPPKGWLPKANRLKERAYLFPTKRRPCSRAPKSRSCGASSSASAPERDSDARTPSPCSGRTSRSIFRAVGGTSPSTPLRTAVVETGHSMPVARRLSESGSPSVPRTAGFFLRKRSPGIGVDGLVCISQPVMLGRSSEKR